MNWDDIRKSMNANICNDAAILSYQGTQNNRYYDGSVKPARTFFRKLCKRCKNCTPALLGQTV